jgi:hypothetical protein
MKRKLLLGAVVSIVVCVALVAGFLLGRSSVETNPYYAPLSAVETALVGHWQIVSSIDNRPASIEFRKDRTAIKFHGNGEIGLTATWGRIEDQLSIQAVRVPGETGGYYIPPALFRVLKVADGKASLVSSDGSVTWELTRI